MADLIPCSGCGNLILVKDDIKYQRPQCYHCTEKNFKKVLDKSKGSVIINGEFNEELNDE